MRLLHINDIEHTLKCQLVKIQTVTHIVVGRYCLGVVVYHHRAPAFLTDSVQSLNTAPVELNRRTNAVSTRSKYDDTLLVVLKLNIASHTAVGYIQIVGLCRILCSQSVYLLNNRQDTKLLTAITNQQQCLVHIAGFALQSDGTCNLEVGKTVYLCLTQQFLFQSIDILFLQLLIYVDDMLKFLKEPLINLCQLVNAIDVILFIVHGLRDNEDTLIGWLTQCSICIIYLQFLILYKSVHALTNHT